MDVVAERSIKRIGIIGAGIFVKDTYIPYFNKYDEHIRLTAILSRSVESINVTLGLLTDQGKGVERYVGPDGEEAFFSRINDICDGVIIVVPIPLLSKYIERCLQANVHILSEKPVAMTSSEAERLISMYRLKTDAKLWHVAENYRTESAMHYARQLVMKYHLQPKTFSLTALRQQTATSKFAVTSWRVKPDYTGSFVFDGGIHFIAMLRFVMNNEISEIVSTYDEQSVVEVGACGSCRVGNALGTFHIRYGAFIMPVCKLDIYFDDAILNIVQHKGVGYEVSMTGKETKRFGFDGLETEFSVWLNTFSGVESAALSPEEGFADLNVIEKICGINTK
jgi:predicted dehydrogenase